MQTKSLFAFRNLLRLTTQSGCLFVLTGLGLLGQPYSAGAQNGPTELVAPSGPTLLRPERPVSWKIIFKHTASKDQFASDNRPLEVSVTAQGDTILESIKFPKRGINVWHSGGHIFISDPESGRFELYLPALTEPDQPTPPEPSAEFQDWTSLNEFDWVKSDLFQGSIKLGNDILHVYAQLPEDMLEARRAAAAAARPIAGRPAAPAAKAPPAPKWPAGPIGGLPLRPDIKVVAVDANTRRPRYLQLGEELREYVFSVPNAETLELPRPIQERLKTLRP
jgi:hypothetical protein